jgi:hypothetical protein
VSLLMHVERIAEPNAYLSMYEHDAVKRANAHTRMYYIGGDRREIDSVHVLGLIYNLSLVVHILGFFFFEMTNISR